MTVKELKNILNKFNDNDSVIVFDEETTTLKEVVSASKNGDCIQLNTEK